jgi:tetratricopeptide (TPR) repeat protein
VGSRGSRKYCPKFSRNRFSSYQTDKVNRSTRLCIVLAIALLSSHLTSTAVAQVRNEVRLDSGNYTISVHELKMSSRVRDRLSRADKDFQRADLAGALAEVRGALAEDPKCARALTMLALVKLAANDPEEAVADSRQATVIDGNDPQAFLALATAFNALHDFEQAQRAAESALRLLPNLWQAHLEIAKSLYGGGKLLPALHELENLHIDFADVHLVRGDVLMLLNRHQDAIDEFTKFLNEAPHDPRSRQVRQIVTTADLSPLHPSQDLPAGQARAALRQKD